MCLWLIGMLSVATVVYSYEHICMRNHNDNTMTTSDTVLWKNIPLTLFERVVCERELETKQNCNILTPTLMATSVSFLFSWAALQHHFSNRLNFLCTQLYNSSPPTQSPPITGHRNMHFHRLWNGMFDRHQAEITVMQFTGHSLPVHQFVTTVGF